MSNEKNAETTTHCHDCVFAEFVASYDIDGNEDGELQYDCKLKRLDKFSDKEIIDIDYIKAYKINRICMGCRDDNWAEGRKDIIADVYKEMEISIDFIIVLDTVSITALDKTFQSIVNQDIKPRSVILVIDDSKYKEISGYFTLLKNIMSDNDIKYQLVRCFEDDAVYERLVDVGVNKCRSVLYTHYRSGEIVPEKFTVALNDYYNKELKRFIYIEGNEDYHDVVFTSYHKLMGGNDAGYIGDKIKFKAKEQDNLELVHEWKNICTPLMT